MDLTFDVDAASLQSGYLSKGDSDTDSIHEPFQSTRKEKRDFEIVKEDKEEENEKDEDDDGVDMKRQESELIGSMSGSVRFDFNRTEQYNSELAKRLKTGGMSKGNVGEGSFEIVKMEREKEETDEKEPVRTNEDENKPNDEEIIESQDESACESEKDETDMKENERLVFRNRILTLERELKLEKSSSFVVQQEVERLELKMNKQEETIINLTKQIDGKDLIIQDLEEQLNQKADEQSNVEEENGKLEEMVRENKYKEGEIFRLTKLNEELTGRVTELDNRLKQLNKESKIMKTKVLQLTKDNYDLKADLKKREEKEQSQDEIDCAEEDNDDLDSSYFDTKTIEFKIPEKLHGKYESDKIVNLIDAYLESDELIRLLIISESRGWDLADKDKARIALVKSNMIMRNST